MHVQIVNFGLKNLTDEDYRANAGAMAPAFAHLPGLVSKTWLANAEANTYGGVYLWRDRQSMEAYQASDIYKGMLENPHFENVTVTDFSVLEGPTNITRETVRVAQAVAGPRLQHAPGGAVLMR
jgi:heme-degrading monooxygenase HmoA